MYLSTKEILSVVTVEGGSALFLFMDSSTMNSGTLYRFSFSPNSESVYQIVEAKDRQLVYILLITRDGSDIGVMNPTTKALTGYFSIAGPTIITLVAKHGFVVYGGSVNSRALLVRTPLTDVHLFSDLLIQTSASHTLNAYTGSEYSVDQFSISFTSDPFANSVAELDILGDVVEANATTTEYSRNSTIVFSKPLYDTLSVNQGEGTTYDIGGPYYLSGEPTLTYDIKVDGSTTTWATVDGSGSFTVTPPVTSGSKEYEISVTISPNSGSFLKTVALTATQFI